MPLLAAIAALVLAPVADFSGTYKGTTEGIEFELKLTQKDKDLSGKATSPIITFNLTGKVDGEKAEGTMKPDGDDEKLFFRATLKDRDLEMKIAEAGDDGKADWSEADTISFKRTGEAPANNEKEPEGKISKFVKKPIETLGSGKEYTHASGGKFRYPASWTIREDETFGLILTPPDAVEGKEVYIINAESAEGAADPASKQVSDYLNSQLSAIATGVKKVGGIESAPAGNAKGAIYTWDATVNGQASRVRAYVTILKGRGVALVAIGPEKTIEAREKELRSMFYTFGWGQGKIDQRIVGKWQFYSFKSGRETKASAVLAADGTFSYQSSSEFSASASGKDSLGNQTWTGWVNSRGGDGWKGTWFADGSEITLNFEDGSSESWDYKLVNQGGVEVMILTGSDPKKPFEWSRSG